MKTKTTFTLLLLTVSIMSFGQDIIEASELRKIVMKSDVVLASDSYNTTSHYANDYSIEQFYTINKIDTLIRDLTKFKIADKIRIQQRVNDYSDFWSEIPSINTTSDMIVKFGVRYTNLFFLKKENKQYKLLGIAVGMEWSDFIHYYIPAINQLMQIEKISNLDERYTKTIDWFIENNDYPDDNFFAFYAEKNIPKDGIFLTAEQQKRATENFLKGNENLRPFVDEKTQKAYSLEKFKKIKNSSKPDSWQFYYILFDLYSSNNDTVDFLLRTQLTSCDLDDSYRDMIMDYFIKRLEEEIKAEK